MPYFTTVHHGIKLFFFNSLYLQHLTRFFVATISLASKIVVKHVNRSHKIVQKWRVEFLKNEGEILEYLRGTYARLNCVANDEDLTKHAALVEQDPAMPQSAWVIFEFSANRDGYWNNDHFMEQMETAVKVAEAKYPPRIFNHVWVFDHSCGHTAYAADALVASRLNKKSGSNQLVMRDTMWSGKPQKLVEPDGTPKGAAKILQERGIQTSSLKLEDMRTILANHDDFRSEKNALHVETMLTGKGHTAVFLPKFH